MTNYLNKPVIKHAVPPNRQTGLLVPPKQAEPLAEALARLIRDPILADTLRQNAYQRFQQDFTKQRSLEMTLPVYQSYGLV